MAGGEEGADQKLLQIPLHRVTPFNTDEQKHVRYFLEDDAGKKDVIVSWSTDPEWVDSTEPVAEITALTVENDKTVNDELKWDEDYFRLQFNEQAKSFKEGYVYVLKVPFAEKIKVIVASEEEGGEPTETEKTLTGTFDVALKIVPEYVTYQGNQNGSRNWNNDELWYRATQADLYDSDDSRSNKYKGKENAGTFTPMDFTNVIIQNKEVEKPYSAYPYLYALKQQDENNPVLNMTAEAEIGTATEYIEYDLAVDETYMKIYNGDNNVPTDDRVGFACVRFYGNTCKEIYFKPQTEMPHTEFLTYEKAWIDYELDANRWYTLASPLKGVVAGDMYLPSAGGITDKPNISYAVQKAPAFKDITFVETNGTRWEPPVYMRGWNKTGSGTVVVPGDGEGIQYGQVAAWSNLYNKVNEPFIPTTGFSIGVEAKEGTDKVLFRLPKADTKYSYHPNEVDGNSGNETSITRNDAGKQKTDDQEIKYSSVGSESGLQLVGNPFMAHLDMTKILGTNGGTYYILTENGTEASVIGDGFTVSTAADDATKVAPLQSFLVKKGEITFTTDMQTVADENGAPGLRSALMNEPKLKQLPEIRITAERDGLKNTAVIAYLSYASDGYEEEEDASLLISKEEKAPQVYTTADKQMLAINLTNRLHDIPVGAYGADERPVTLTFSVSDPLSDVTLYDKQEKQSYAVTEGMTLTVPGNTSGRYVLNGSAPAANDVIASNRIVCYSSGNGRIEISSVDPLVRVMVYNLSGQLVTSQTQLHTPTTYIDGLISGQVYVVRAETDNQVQSEKVEVR